MHGVRVGDLVWIFRTTANPAGKAGFRNIGKVLRIVDDYGLDQDGDDCWEAELLEPAWCSRTGDRVPAGEVGCVVKSCVKPLRGRGVDSTKEYYEKELSCARER